VVEPVITFNLSEIYTDVDKSNINYVEKAYFQKLHDIMYKKKKHDRTVILSNTDKNRISLPITVANTKSDDKNKINFFCETLLKYLIKELLIPSSTIICNSCKLENSFDMLLSKPGCKKQKYHYDYENLNEGSSLIYNIHSDKTQYIHIKTVSIADEKIEIKPNHFVLFHGSVLHCGAENQSSESLKRIFMYLPVNKTFLEKRNINEVYLTDEINIDSSIDLINKINSDYHTSIQNQCDILKSYCNYSNENGFIIEKKKYIKTLQDIKDGIEKILNDGILNDIK
jgi:hypothetical protein